MKEGIGGERRPKERVETGLLYRTLFNEINLTLCCAA
jgi:hypothetical protein